jgi:hypothetical protein
VLEGLGTAGRPTFPWQTARAVIDRWASLCLAAKRTLIEEKLSKVTRKMWFTIVA